MSFVSDGSFVCFISFCALALIVVVERPSGGNLAQKARDIRELLCTKGTDPQLSEPTLFNVDIVDAGDLTLPLARGSTDVKVSLVHGDVGNNFLSSMLSVNNIAH